eukprot:3645692-Prymnesium_polylepis.2
MHTCGSRRRSHSTRASRVLVVPHGVACTSSVDDREHSVKACAPTDHPVGLETSSLEDARASRKEISAKLVVSTAPRENTVPAPPHEYGRIQCVLLCQPCTNSSSWRDCFGL